MAIYEVTLNSTFFNNRCVNRWNYVSSGIPAAVSGSFGLAFAFGLAPVGGSSTIFGNIKTATSNQVTYESYRIVNLYEPEDFYSAPFGTPQVGSLASDAMGPVNAWGFRTNQVTLAISRGTKRFVGVPEAEVIGGGLVGGSINTSQLIPLATKMGAILTYTDEGTPITYSPAVLGRQEYTTPSGKTAYRKWPTEADQLAHAAIGITWEPYATVRSQTSRQYGRGV